MNKTELNTALDSLKVKFNTEQTQKENTILVQNNEIHQKTISLQRAIIVSSVILALLFITIFILIIRNRKKIRMKNILLESGNAEISRKAEELKTVNDRLVELSTFKDAMSSFLVHDLKNPLNTIIHFEPGKDPDHQIRTVRQSGRQMQNIVMNLLDISKYENQEMNLSKEDTSLIHLMNMARENVIFTAEQKNLRFYMNFSKDFMVRVDPSVTERVFINLFTNAVKFSPGGGEIRVSASPNGSSMLKIAVEDRGEGIEAALLPRIFDRYVHGNLKKSGIGVSTGIGLAFCKMVVESHGGKIGAESEPDKGTTIWLTLPLADSRDESGIMTAFRESPSSGYNNLQLNSEEKKILLPVCGKLKTLGINQISDVKEAVISVDDLSENIATWKRMILKALADCNQTRYDELINLCLDDNL